MSKEGFWNQSIPRREFIKKTADSALLAAGVIAGRNTGEQIQDLLGPDGLKLNPLLSDVNDPQVTPEPQRHELLSTGRKFITIQHGAGDSLDGMQKAAENGADYADFNLKLINGKLMATHAKTKINNFGKVLLDYDPKTTGLRLNPDICTLEEIIEKASEVGIGLFGELNEGSFNNLHVEKLIRLSQEKKVKLMMHAKMKSYGNLIQYGREIDQNPENWLDVPMGFNSWERFKQIDGPKGVLTNLSSAELYSDYLGDAFVIIGEIDSQEDYTKATNLPVVNGTLLYNGFNPETNIQ